MSLTDQIDKRRRDIKTDGYPISISEWAGMYEKNELDIHPEFQRFYRWTPKQKTGLVESILLGIPVPPIFVSQRKDGVWDVVDGLQRLSSIFQFMGILKNKEGELLPPLELESTKYLPELKGTKWEEQPTSPKTLPKDLQLAFKRSKISASIVLKESDTNAKYDLFQRLNTGGSELSPQEVRNCLLVMMNQTLFEWLKDLPTNKDFVESTALSDRPLEQSYDVELALRFLVIALINEGELKSIGDVGEFLTDKMSAIAINKKFKKKDEKSLFDNTFRIINETLGDGAFKRYNKAKKRHEGGFLLSLFETIAFGIAYNFANDTLCKPTEIITRVRGLSSNKIYSAWSSSGITANRRLPHLIPLGRTLFSK